MVEAAASDEGVVASAPPAKPPAAVVRPRWRRVVRRIGIGLGVTVATIVALVALLYFFGGMERPSAEHRAAYNQLVAEDRAAPIENRFVIPIPGCRCHSDDSVAQMQHSVWRIRECAGCHAR